MTGMRLDGFALVLTNEFYLARLIRGLRSRALETDCAADVSDSKAQRSSPSGFPFRQIILGDR